MKCVNEVDNRELEVRVEIRQVRHSENSRGEEITCSAKIKLIYQDFLNDET